MERIPAECVLLKQKILKLHKKNFKDKLGKLDRVTCDPVQLKIDPRKEIRPIKNTHCYDILTGLISPDNFCFSYEKLPIRKHLQSTPIFQSFGQIFYENELMVHNNGFQSCQIQFSFSVSLKDKH